MVAKVGMVATPPVVTVGKSTAVPFAESPLRADRQALLDELAGTERSKRAELRAKIRELSAQILKDETR